MQKKTVAPKTMDREMYLAYEYALLRISNALRKSGDHKCAEIVRNAAIVVSHGAGPATDGGS